MSRFTDPIFISRPSGLSNDGSAPTNAAGLQIADNTGAAIATQEAWIYQVNAAAGNEPFYAIGYGGTFFSGGAISIPNVGQASAQDILTIPAGSRIQNINLNLLQAPTAITTGSLAIALNGTNIGAIAIGAALGNGSIVFATTLAALRLIAFVGNTDAVLTASLSGTGITGGILAELSVQYTVRRGDGSIVPYGQGYTNDGSGPNSAQQ